MKKLSIPSAMVGLMFGLIATVFVYLLVPPPSTASAASCPSSQKIKQIVQGNCASTYDVRKYNRRYQGTTVCASKRNVEDIVQLYCS